MNYPFRHLLVFLLCLTFSMLNGQSKVTDLVVEPSKAIKIGTTQPITSLLQIGATAEHKKAYKKSIKKRPDNFVGRKAGNKIVHPELVHQGHDRVRQSHLPNLGINIEPKVNIDGLTIGSSPQDPSGDVGPDHYIQGINITEIGVFDKEGNLIQSFAANVLWQPLGFTSAGDPIILYDQEVDRWFITEFPDPNELLIAISTTPDPLGEYHVYNFSTPSFPDYPKYAIWDKFLTVTTNESTSNLALYALDKIGLINGEEQVDFQRMTIPGSNNTEAGFFVATPVDWTGQRKPADGSGPYFMRLNDSSWGDVDQDQVDIYEASIDFTDPSNTTFNKIEIALSPYDSNPCAVEGFGFSCVPQPDGIGLDGIPEVIMNQAHYRNFGTHESMVFNFITDATDGNNLSGIRWVELRKISGGEWALYQEGTYAPDDGLHRYMGGICMDGQGNIALAYNVSNEDIFVGVRFTGRRASDPLGEMTINEYVVVEGENTINSGSRFGDYGHMSIDPADDKTFWYTTEYANGGVGAAATRIVAYEIKRDSNDLAVGGLISPQSSSDLTGGEQVIMEIVNAGFTTQSSFELSYSFDGSSFITEKVDSILQSDSVYVHTFNSLIDFDEIRGYPITVVVHIENDESRINDTLNTVVFKYPTVDLAITELQPESDFICKEITNVQLSLENKGTITQDSLLITIAAVNGEIDSIIYRSPLAFRMSAIINLPITDFKVGRNDIIVNVEAFEGVDFDPSDNEDSLSFNYDDQRLNYILNLTFDDYPEETSWQLVTQRGTLIAQGDNYFQRQVTIVEPFCLEPDSCYIFSLFDSFGDGITADGVTGDYKIFNQSGELVAALIDEDFGEREDNEFCAKSGCNLQVDVTSSPVSMAGAADGTLMLIPVNGVGPFQYSIDGGVTFQMNNTFDNLTEGAYNIVVKGGEDCEYRSEFIIVTCALEISSNIQSASSATAADGAITLEVSNGIAPYRYSIDNGVNFQANNEFTELAAGIYNVVVTDEVKCLLSTDIEVPFTSSATSYELGKRLVLSPNPTTGLFQAEIHGLESASFKVKGEVYDLAGNRIRIAPLYKYGNIYKGEISLTSEPAGTYLFRIKEEGFTSLYKVVKL